jgi:hypothetical protein
MLPTASSGGTSAAVGWRCPTGAGGNKPGDGLGVWAAAMVATRERPVTIGVSLKKRLMDSLRDPIHHVA